MSPVDTVPCSPFDAFSPTDRVTLQDPATGRTTGSVERQEGAGGCTGRGRVGGVAGTFRAQFECRATRIRVQA